MLLINRDAAIVRPKKLFVDWLNKLPDSVSDHVFSLEEVRERSHVYLINPSDSEFEADNIINKMKPEIFEKELFAWCTHEPWWPKVRTAKVFDQWFEVEFHQMVIDTLDGEFEGLPF